ncbi:DUF4190 domain-containing protein [Flexivirga sp. B27]
MTSYPNDPNQPDGYGEQPKDGSGNPQYGSPQYGAQPYGSPQYGAPQQGSPYGGAVEPQEHDKATLIMILGILSIPCCGLFTGIPAIIMGRQALQQIDASGGMLGGRSKVQAGFICGIIGTAWTIVAAIVRLAG